MDEVELNKFGSKIGLPFQIPQYLSDLVSFFQNNYPKIIQYFSGRSESLSREDVDTLNNLIKNWEDLSQRISINNHSFTTYKAWEIADYLEDIRDELKVVSKISKFLRSSKTNYNFDGTIEFDYITSSKETLEQVSGKILGSQDYDNDWVDISLRNDLFELDYDLSGGENLKLAVKLTSSNSTVRGVVDNISGEKILGKDIKRFINFKDDDLEVLSYNKTATQSVEILATLLKGDVPEDITFGRTPVVGSTKNAIVFTTVVREMIKTFTSDDTLEDFTVKKIEEKGGGDFNIIFEVATRNSTIINNNVIA